jgi:hypothetical protein
MAGYSATALNQALDGITVDRVRLHTGDPGSDGTSGTPLGAGTVAATFSAASGGERLLASDVEFTGLGTSASVGFFSIWLNAGTVFKGGFAITSGDTAANAAGEYTLKATTTKLTASNPA